MSAFFSLSVAALKGFFRDKVALFFSFAFPLMFIVIFGVFFSGTGSDPFEVAVVGDGPVMTALEQTGAFDLQRYDTFQEAFTRVADGTHPALVAEEGTIVTVRFAAGAQNAAATVRGVVDGVVNRVNLQAADAPAVFQVNALQVEDTSFEPIQFIVPGIMSFGVALGAVFGSAFTLVVWRKSQVLRRIRSAPVSTTTVLGSRLVATLLIGVAQAALFITVGITVFGLQLPGRWWLAIPILLLGIVAFFAVGLVIGALCKTEEATSGVTNAIILPMSFLSGVFIPLEVAPAWIRQVSEFMPLKHMNEAIVDIWVRGEGVQSLGVPSLILAGFAAVMVLIAARVFRWEAS